MSAAPTVSIITSAYNGEALVGDTIRSVLAQTFTDFEMIVVDDCSSDGTLAVLRGFDDPRLRIVAAEVNRGPVGARNHAVTLARGRYIAGLDQDDLCRPERLAEQVAYLDAHPEAVLVGTAAELLEDGRLRPSSAPPRTSPELIRFLLGVANPLVWSSVMMRAEAARRLDPFTRPEMVYAEDFDLYHRIAAFGEVARLDTPLMVYRVHAAGVSKIHADRMMDATIRVIAAAHGKVLGDDPAAGAALVARHFAGRLPAPDLATLARVADILDRLLEAFLGARPLPPAAEALLAEEASRLWWELVRASIRSGLLTRREALSVRPASPLVDRDPRKAGMFKAELVGLARAFRNRRVAVEA